jgi:DNA-binding CsgD family transcriptional regulator
MRTMDEKRLTLRERQVIELIGQGLRGRAIAERLGMAYFTLRKHRLNILRKHGLTTAAQLSAAAAAMLDVASEPNRNFRPGGAALPLGRWR